MTFSSYGDPLGMPPSLWGETQDSVRVEKGIFSVLLGSVNPMPDSIFDGSVIYLAIKVGTDSEMKPLKAIVSVGYAYHSLVSDTAHFAMPGTCSRHSGAQIFNGTATTNWTDLDLSSYVGSNHALVVIKVKGASGSSTHVFRPNGDTDEYWRCSDFSDMGSQGHKRECAEAGLVVLETDAHGIIEWRSNCQANVTLTLLGYVK